MKGAELPTIYTDVVISLESGEVSAPFRSASSFHIVKINDMRSSIQRSEIDQVLVRHILVTPNEIVDDATAILRWHQHVWRFQKTFEKAFIATSYTVTVRGAKSSAPSLHESQRS